MVLSLPELLVLLQLFTTIFQVNAGYLVEIICPEYAVVGSSINFIAKLYDDKYPAKSSSYMFTWSHNVKSKQNEQIIYTKEPFSNWTVEYPIDTHPGKYTISVKVDRNYLVWIDIADAQHKFELTDSLTGDMLLLQANNTQRQLFVSSNEAVNHSVALVAHDFEYLNQKASYIQSFWFQNCTYLGVSDGYNYEAIYSKPDEYYEVEALLVASFEALPEPIVSTTTSMPTTTTTSTTSSTTTTTTSTTTTSTTTPRTTLTNDTKTNTQMRRKRDLKKTMQANAELLGLNLTAVLHQQQQQHNKSYISSPILAPLLNSKVRSDVHRISALRSSLIVKPPFDCVNKSIIARDPKKAYGYFKRHIVSKAPVSNFTTSGKNWLKQGDLLNLQIACKGSTPLKICSLVFRAPYNATGKEVCTYFEELESCNYKYYRFFRESKTVLFFIRNNVSESVNQVTINIYEAKKQSQLSVVVVPVTCSLVAVILVVFGVSYYLQSRNRFNVEVADFNFGETQSVDMSYKTFQQRLVESMRDALPRWRHYSQSMSDLVSESTTPNIDGVGGGNSFSDNVGDVDSNLHYNQLN